MGTLRSSLRMFAGFGIVLGLVACDEAPAPAPAGVRLDLEGCVADDDAAGGCRDRLATEAAAGACLLLVPGGDSARFQALSLTWQNGRLAPLDPNAVVSLMAGETFETSLFALRAATACDGLDLRGACLAADGCVARYGPVEHLAVPGDTTRIHFMVDGACRVEQAEVARAAFVEICGDGIDNDCDGLSEEDLVEPCFVGLGECRVEGERQSCIDGNYVCQATPGSPEPDANCNGQDDDCDGLVDEAGDCDACLFDNECLATPETGQCVEGRCVECDPENGDGCSAEAPICDGASRSCRGCAGDGECAGDDVCVNGACRRCDPNRQAQTCPDPLSPTCDPETYTCRPCRDGPECVSGICFGGQCAVCDPVNNAGCLAPTVICDRASLSCRTCAQDAECAALDADNPVCSEGVCVECDVGTNSGCADPARPICLSDPPGAPPRCLPCDDDGECASGQCRNGRCVGCDPVDNSGCEPLGAQPICDDGDGGEAFCRACGNDIECPGGLGRGICNAGSCRECADVDARGCAEDGDEPICEGGQCRVCAADGECALRPGNLDLCVENRCALCDPETNRGCEGDAPVCRDGRCQACLEDIECGGGQQCVGGRCRVCDPNDNAGCGPDAPVCEGGNACGPCNADGQCPDNDLCVGGTCVECEPRSNRGCPEAGATPICDPATATCTRCANDGDCAPGQCLPDGRCAQCDPIDNAGCADEPGRPICGADGECRSCALDAECVDRELDPVCDLATGRCRVCLAGTNRGCDPASDAPVCEGNQCRRCQADEECGAGALCVAGQCQGCNPQDNSGCDPASDAPICVGGACVPCVDDNQCRDPQLNYCAGGRCVECSPATGDGCDPGGARPFCAAGSCVACGAADRDCAELDPDRGQCLQDGRCAPCNPIGNVGCDPNGVAPICGAETLFCQGCINDDECGARYCDLAGGGRCQDCLPGSNVGCDPGGDDPICDPDDFRCVPCERSSECGGNPNGEICRLDGLCGCTRARHCPQDRSCEGFFCVP